mmetsp:Transcript_4655/g.10864  ORF Transcript_4655/g.10864 Transcript_4655/m.10864 type:complete len:201 (-) Transcript_4655:272-874(-)
MLLVILRILLRGLVFVIPHGRRNSSICSISRISRSRIWLSRLGSIKRCIKQGGDLLRRLAIAFHLRDTPALICLRLEFLLLLWLRGLLRLHLWRWCRLWCLLLLASSRCCNLSTRSVPRSLPAGCVPEIEVAPICWNSYPALWKRRTVVSWRSLLSLLLGWHRLRLRSLLCLQIRLQQRHLARHARELRVRSWQQARNGR